MANTESGDLKIMPLTLVDKALTPGVHTFRFEANGLPSGVYFYRIEAGELFQTRRLMLLK